MATKKASSAIAPTDSSDSDFYKAVETIMTYLEEKPVSLRISSSEIELFKEDTYGSREEVDSWYGLEVFQKEFKDRCMKEQLYEICQRVIDDGSVEDYMEKIKNIVKEIN